MILENNFTGLFFIIASVNKCKAMSGLPNGPYTVKRRQVIGNLNILLYE